MLHSPTHTDTVQKAKLVNGSMTGIYKPVKVYVDARVERTDIGIGDIGDIGDIGVKANIQKVPTETSEFIQRAGDARGAQIV